MMRKFLLISLAVFCAAAMLTSMTKINPNNPPLGNTGAPGETTCQKSGCHSGGNFNGTAALSGLPDSVEAGVAYSLTLTLTSDCAKGGFELTCLDADDNKCGTLSTGTGTSVAMFAGNQYVRQSSPRSLTGGTVSWSFTWTCPDVVPGNMVTFYFAMLNANGNGHDSGDNVSTGDTSAVFKEQIITTSIHDGASTDITLSPNPVRNQLTVQYPGATPATLLIFDLSGNIVFHREVKNGLNIIDLTEIPAGVYTASVKAADYKSVKKLVIQ